MLRTSARRCLANSLANVIFKNHSGLSASERCYATTTAEAEELPADWANAKPYDSIPGPIALPIVGTAWRFIGGVDFLQLVQQIHRKYGDVVIMRKLLAFGDLTFLFNIRDIEWLLRNEGPWPYRDGFASSTKYRHEMRKDIYGDTLGLVNGQHEKWGSFRSAVNPIMMQPRTTHQYIPQINDIGDEFIVLVRKFMIQDANNEMPANFIDELSKWAFESITAIALDTRLGVLGEKPNERGEKALNYLLETFGLLLKLDFLPTGKFHIKYNTPTFKKFVRNQDYFTNLCLQLIEEAEQKIQNDPNYAQKPEHEKSVFEKLVAKDKKVAMVMTLDMLGAGVDTTAKIVGATLYFLAKSPNAQETLRKELKRLLPSKDTRITKEILDDAKYLRAVIKEALRLAPIGSGNIRRMTKAVVLGGYQIPAGTMVSMPNLYLCKMVDTHYSNPQEYIPERWLRDVKTEAVNAFVSLPFGFGARSCIGKRMASMEIEVILAKMVRSFALEWHHKDMTFKQELLYGIADPLKLKVTELPN